MKYVVSYYNLKYDILVMCYSTNHGGAGLTKIQIYCGILYSLATKHLYTHIHLNILAGDLHCILFTTWLLGN